MAEQPIRVERDGGVAAVVVDRPEARNALTAAMRAEMLRIFGELANDPELRVVTLRGTGGKSFISGADLNEFAAARGAEPLIEQSRRDEELYRAIEAVPAPVVALIEGFALGGGLMLAGVCDLRVCSADSRFGITVAKLGNCLSPGMYPRLAALVGPARLKQMLLGAELIDAETALHWGLVSEVVEPAAFEQRVAALTTELASFAPLAQWATKESLRRVAAGDPGGEDVMERVLGSEDFREGVDAFLEKRQPRWRNR